MIPVDRPAPRTWVLLALSGVILGLAYPPNPIGLFGSIGLVPLLVALERARTWRQMLLWSYGSLVIFSALSSWWIGSWQARADPFLMISCVLLVIIHPLFFMVPLVVYRWVRLRQGWLYALMFLPLLWTGGEYLHALTDASYPWLTLGNTQTYNLYFVQFIEFTGIWGVSFLLMVQNAVFTAMIFSLGMEPPLQTRLFRTGMTVLALTLVPPFLYGFVVLGKERPLRPERTLTVTVVQPNVDPWDKWRQSDTTDHVALNAGLSLRAPSAPNTELFLWSENAIPYPVKQAGYENRKAALDAAIERIGVPVMTGFPDYVVYDASDRPPTTARYLTRYDPVSGGSDTIGRWDYFNSVGIWIPGKGLTDIYHKMQLVPFGERIPFVDDVPWLTGLLSWDVGISSWAKGRHVTTFAVPVRDTVTYAASVICFESVYPNVVRQFVEPGRIRPGANFLTIVTNDGWYLGTPGPLQHLRIGAMRAIETRRSIARAANTGISGFVSPYGEITGETDEGITTTTSATIELRDEQTFYVRWGDWFPQLCLLIAGAMLISPLWRQRRRRFQG